MPKTGTANYQTSVVGTAGRFDQSTYALAPNSTASFSANFGAGTVSTTLNLSGSTSANPIAVNLGSYTGTGTITAGGPGFSGTLASAPSNTLSSTGQFAGAFFGPQAKEMAYSWYLTGNIGAQGVVLGTK